MNPLLLTSFLYLLISQAKSQVQPPISCEPQQYVCKPGTVDHGCAGGVMAFCNQLGQCCVSAVPGQTGPTPQTFPTPPPNPPTSCKPVNPACTKNADCGGTYECKQGQCCVPAETGLPPQTFPTPPTSCRPMNPACTKNADCGGAYECKQGQCCMPAKNDSQIATADLKSCSDPNRVLLTLTSSQNCMDIIEDISERGITRLMFCKTLIRGLECVALRFVGEDLKKPCVDAMFEYIKGNKDIIKKLLTSDELEDNMDFANNAFQCREIVNANGGDNQADWNTKCPAVRVIQKANCNGGCVSDTDCTTSNYVCCTGPNSCPVCLPDLTRCADPDSVLSSAGSCLTQLSALANPNIDFATYCRTIWSGVNCIAKSMMNVPDYSKLCVERMAQQLKRSPADILQKIVDMAANYGVNLGVVTKYGNDTAKCKENPLYEPETRPVPQEKKSACGDVSMIVPAFRQCLGNNNLAAESNSACSTLKDTVYCVARTMVSQAKDEYEISRCAGEIQDVIEQNKAKFEAMIGALKLAGCAERMKVCGRDKQPSDVYFCRTGSCPAGYDCKGGYCCPLEKAGMCPQSRGVVPVCKRKCTKDSECDDDDKCCDIGCGYKTCIKSEAREKSRCEKEFEDAKKQLEKDGICGDGKSILKVPRCQNSGYFPIQGDLQHGRMYCVTEQGDKIPGSDFTGNMDCTSVRPGKCPAKPAQCNDTASMITQCKRDKDCKDGEKCCLNFTEEVCVRTCVPAEKAPLQIADDCPNRQCCPITLCQDKICAKDKTAVCRINSCGGCTVEFYNAAGDKVDCETNVPLCERKRAEAQHANAQKGKSDDQRVVTFLKSHEKMGGMHDDMDDMADDMGHGDMMNGGMMGKEDDDETMTDEYGERRENMDRLPNDTMNDEKMEDMGIEHDQMLAYKLERFCSAFMKFNICQHNSTCVLGKGESFWQICKCPVGYYGLFCEKQGTPSPNDTMCYRDSERIKTMMQVLRKADQLKEKMILHELFDNFRIPFGLIPNFSCTANGTYTTLQAAITFPKTSNLLALYYCAHTNNGTKILGTPVSMVMLGLMPNCSKTGLRPDPLKLPRKCLAAKKMNCTTPACQYFWNQARGICEQGAVENGFTDLTECYDQCSKANDCDKMTGASCGPAPCKITIGDVVTDQCDYATQFCKVSDVGGSQEGTCKSFPAHCLLDHDEGYGDKHIGAYYFDAKTRRCEKFEYKGSGGNTNRFYTLHQCHTECGTRSYKYQEVVCPIPKAMSTMDKGMIDMCDDDYTCPDDAVCCSDGTSRKCMSPIVTCITGERCSLEGACVDGKCTCRECTDTSAAAPVCGSDGKTYDNMCLLQREACLSMRPLKKLSDGPCTIECGGKQCKLNQLCENNQCVCPSFCTAQYAPVCGRGMNSGVLRTFSNDCEMKRHACNMTEIFVKVQDGECVTGKCQLPCTKEYQPVCAYDTTSATPKLTTYSNICEMKRDAICNNTKLEVLDAGPCIKQCGTTQCTLYEVCENDRCTCPSMCTLEYRPLCAYIQGNPSSAKTFSNGCQMKLQGCQEKKIYFIQKHGPCEEPQPMMTCPLNDPNIPFSAEIACDQNTHAFCDNTTEMCCPYGAGTRCIPKKALIRPMIQKDGICPMLSYINFEKSQCIPLKSEDDGDCAGEAKSCWNMLCGHNTCTAPLVRKTATTCPTNYSMIPEVSCDPGQAVTGCPNNALCRRVNTTGNDETGVCCMPNSQTLSSPQELLGSRLCQLMAMLGIKCMNGGTCVGDLRNGTICACATGYYGPFCGSRKPNATCATPVNCIINPCDTAVCPGVPNAQCGANYCGGCNALFTNNTGDVTHLCEATPCLRKKAAMKLLYDKVVAHMGSQEYMKENMGGDSMMAMMEDELDPAGIKRHLFYILEKMGLHGLPKDGNLNCSAGGQYDPIQCSWIEEQNSTKCYCVHPRSGEPIPNGPTSMSRETLNCSVFMETNVGLQPFCLMLPNMTRVCSATESVRYFYNPATSDCEAFTDTGCNENTRNNFNSYETCKSVCGVRSSVLSMCARVRCGYNQHCRVRDGTAECVDPEDEGQFEPVCDSQGMFEPKQCQGDVCRCVKPETGEELPNSIADGVNLECKRDGQTVNPMRTGQKACPKGGIPKFCENGGDPCNNCQPKEQQQTNSRPNANTKTNDKRVCTSCETCPAGQVRQDCGQIDPCKNTTCKSDSKAVCRVNRCTCMAEFVSGNRSVDCSKAQSQCMKEKSEVEIEERSKALSNNGKVSEDAVQLKCSQTGGYEVKCTGTDCKCLNATSGESVGTPVKGANINSVDCSKVQQKTKAERVKVTLKVSDKPLSKLSDAQKEQIKSKLKAEFEARVPVKVTDVKLFEGSTKADILVENCVENCQTTAETKDLPSLVGTVVSDVESGQIQIVAGGETFIPSSAAITGIQTSEDIGEPAEDSDDDYKTKVIIIVVVVVGVTVLVAIGIAVYCYKKTNKSKMKEIPFSDLEPKSRGQDNPMYVS